MENLMGKTDVKIVNIRRNTLNCYLNQSFNQTLVIEKDLIHQLFLEQPYQNQGKNTMPGLHYKCIKVRQNHIAKMFLTDPDSF